jgi:hypothetical protein
LLGVGGAFMPSLWMLLSFLSKESNQRKVAAASCSLKGSACSVPVPPEQANAAFGGYRSVRSLRFFSFSTHISKIASGESGQNNGGHERGKGIAILA